ncbi:MAG: cell wall hydrolase [Clostridiales bacterium]|nr:cell wall hydrolase [Clostridiales bacterium]MCF8021956.1 cell wall hydrolase [Clostridiales bacterium]
MSKKLCIICLSLFLILMHVNNTFFNSKEAYGNTAALNNIELQYTIKHGNTLSGIAAKFNISLSQLIKRNKLNSTIIYPGQVLIIPNQLKLSSRSKISREDLSLLSKAIYAESRGESFKGQVAVGAVILNRVQDKHFPSTITKVIMQRNKHIAQFTPVSNGTINLNPNKTAIKAAISALNGKDPTNGALFFYNPKISTDQWITTLPVITRIGNHVFATSA